LNSDRTSSASTCLEIQNSLSKTERQSSTIKSEHPNDVIRKAEIYDNVRSPAAILQPVDSVVCDTPTLEGNVDKAFAATSQTCSSKSKSAIDDDEGIPMVASSRVNAEELQNEDTRSRSRSCNVKPNLKIKIKCSKSVERKKRKFSQSQSYSRSLSRSRKPQKTRERSYCNRTKGRTKSGQRSLRSFSSSRSRSRFRWPSRSRSRRQRSRSRKQRSRSRSRRRRSSELDPLFQKDVRLEELDLSGYDSGGKKIFVGNLGFRVACADLEDIFEKYGRISKCYLTMNRKFGFVLYDSAKSAVDAVRDVYHRQVQLYGRKLRVSLAKSRASSRVSGRSPVKRFPSSDRGKSRDRVRTRSRSRRRTDQEYDLYLRKIVISHLPSDVTERELEDIFNPYGFIERCYPPKDSKSNAYVVFRRPEDASRAIRARHRTEMYGRTVLLELMQRPDSRERSISYSRYDKEGRKLHIGGLSYDLFDRELRDMFAEFGRIEECYVPLGRDNNRPMGYGFVTFATTSGAEAAMRHWDGRKMDKMTIICERALAQSSKMKAPRRRRR